MNNNKIAMSFREFSLLSETQLKVLALSGYDVEITSVATKTSNNTISHNVATTKPVSNNKATNKVSKPVKTNKTTETKGKKEIRKTEKKLAFGKDIKVGSFVKTYNLKDKKVVSVGKVKSIIKDDQLGAIVELTNTRKFAIENCVLCSKDEVKRVRKVVARQEKKASRLDPKVYKLAYAYNLLNLGEIKQADFDEAKNDDKKLKELYDLFAKGEKAIKLSNDEAMKILADNSAKSKVANA